MSNNLHISYDLINPGQNYPAVIKSIQSLGKWAKIHKSFWYVRSNYTALQALEHIKRALDSNDTLYVVDSTNNDAWMYNVSTEAASFIETNWFSNAFAS